MITPLGEAKLLDLGLRRALDDETGLTRANTVLGTLDYASPEQLRDAAKADMQERPVQPGMHAVLRVVRQPSVRGGRHDQQDLQTADGGPASAGEPARGVPAAFAAVVRKLMSKNPEERYQNAAELRADLARWTDPARVHAILGAEADAARSSARHHRSSPKTTCASSTATRPPSRDRFRSASSAGQSRHLLPAINHRHHPCLH